MRDGCYLSPKIEELCSLARVMFDDVKESVKELVGSSFKILIP